MRAESSSSTVLYCGFSFALSFGFLVYRVLWRLVRIYGGRSGCKSEIGGSYPMYIGSCCIRSLTQYFNLSFSSS